MLIYMDHTLQKTLSYSNALRLIWQNVWKKDGALSDGKQSILVTFNFLIRSFMLYILGKSGKADFLQRVHNYRFDIKFDLGF